MSTTIDSNVNGVEFVKLTEYCKPPKIMQRKFTDEEIRIIQTDFNDMLELVAMQAGQHAIKTFHHVGYIVLPKHIISISPKITSVSFINMVRYALELPELKSEDFSVSDEKVPNYYDILVRFLLQELELILQTGLYTTYANYEDNLTSIRGKILFKEQVLCNHNRGDKIFCSFSELTPDILENRIIKYTIFYLSQCRFIEDDINSKLIEYYRRLDQVELAPVYTDTFNSIAYSPLNERYRSILKLCELILRDSSLDLENIGDRNAISFTIDMNKLFEDFVANLLTERLGESNIKLQQTEFPELKGNKLKVRLDIIVLQDGKPVIILDTKYKQYEDDPDMGHIAQLALYSNTTGVKTCGLIYVGNFPNQFIHLKADIKVHILTLNLIAISKQDFELNCSQFIQDLMNLMLEIN